MKLLHHAQIYTLDTSKPVASVIAIDHGEIVAVGGDELLVEFDRAEKQNIGGRVILPGLTDAHLHLQHYALSLEKIGLRDGYSEECLRRVTERVQKAKPGEWILGHGWNQNVWGGWPSAADLDQIAPNHPVLSNRQVIARGMDEQCRNEAGEYYFIYTRSQRRTKSNAMRRANQRVFCLRMPCN